MAYICRGRCDKAWPKYVHAAQFIAGWKWCATCARGIAPECACAIYCPCCGDKTGAKPRGGPNRRRHYAMRAATVAARMSGPADALVGAA